MSDSTLIFIPVGDFLRQWKKTNGTARDLIKLYASIERVGIHARPVYRDVLGIRSGVGNTGSSGGFRTAYFYLSEAGKVYLFGVQNRRKFEGFRKEHMIEWNELIRIIKQEHSSGR